MTFYSIIFGILFVGACKELFQTLLQKNWDEFSEAASVTLLIFNDVLYTSQELESGQVPYLLQMKFIDLVDFLLLAMAIVMIDPCENQLGVKSNSPFKRREFFFWSLLTVYWILTLEWNQMEAVAQELTPTYVAFQCALLLILIAMSMLAAMWPSRLVTTLMRRCIPVLLLVYFVPWKLYIFTSKKTIDRQDLCVTKGEIGALPGGRLAIKAPEVRAVARIATSQAAEMRFTYRGASGNTKPFGSGEVRRQLGLKLRAQNSCNLVYVMWRLEPEAKLVVSIKRNPGQELHAQCGTRGYTDVQPRLLDTVPHVEPGSAHRLRAELLRDRELRVFADGEPVWEGKLGPEIQEFDGPVGLRTDNVWLKLQFLADEIRPDLGATLSAGMPKRCGGQDEDE